MWKWRSSVAILSTLGSHACVRPTRTLRNAIACFALVALAWPSLGPLPYVLAAHAHSHANGAVHGGADHGHFDASAIPGSPTHPDDHDCPECVVLKHLSRCMLPVLAIAVCAPVVVAVVTPRVVFARPPSHPPAHLPPARAPPRPIV
jgi:hypothetical protein